MLPKNMPLVELSFIDHVVGALVNIAPAKVKACGFLVRETKEGYYLCHMLFDDTVADDANEGMFVAKVPGLKIRRLK